MANAWMRQLQVILTSEKLKKKITLGGNVLRGKDDLYISISGTKYLSALKDEFTIKVSNLTYAEICELIDGQYYNVEIKAGYRSCGMHTLFKGGVLYITNIFGDRKTNEVMIFCASNLIAKYGQSRMNLTLNSGINMKAAIEFLSRRAGIQNSNVSDDLSRRILSHSVSTSTSISNWLDLIASQNNCIINSDESYNSVYSIINITRTDSRLITLEPSTIILTNGTPSLSSDGMRLTLMPTFNFMCGDTVVVDNSILDLGFRNKNNWSKNYGYYLDKDGKYVVYQIEYELENRGENFQLEMLCKSKSLFKSIISS